MNEGDLDEFVSRARTTLDRSPEMAEHATELRVVLPFLETLGWNVHGRDVVPEYAVDTDEGDVVVDFALCLDGVPEVFVVTTGAGEELGPDDGKRLATAMTAASVEWGFVTNGHAYAFLTLEAGEARRNGCDLDSLTANRAVVAEYTRDAALERRDERAQEHRRALVDDLAEDRSDLVEAVSEALRDQTDESAPVADELVAASDAFVDGVLTALSNGNHPATFANRTDDRSVHGQGDDRTNTTSTASERSGGTAATGTSSSSSPDDAPTGRGETDAAANGGRGAAAKSDPGASTDEPQDAGDAATDDDAAPVQHQGESDAETEYVVRFFNGRSSVGAVGHSTHGGAMAQAIEYMIEQHSLDSRLNLPWGGNDDRALVNYDPVHPDGSEMAGATQLSNGYYVDTAVDVSISRGAVEQLAEHSGLRVMFRGDWPRDG